MWSCCEKTSHDYTLSPSAGNPVGRGWGHYLFSLSDRSSQIQALIYVYIIYIYHDLSYLSGSFFDLACQPILIIIHSKPIQVPASMKSCFTTTIALVASAAAYPQALLNVDQTLYSPLVQQVSAAAEGLVTSGSSQSTTTPFSATAQKISVSGIHAWRAPGPGDARGMYGFFLMLPQMLINGSFGD